MSYGIHLAKAGVRVLPGTPPNGDNLLEVRRFGSRSSPASPSSFLKGGHATLNRSLAHPKELLGHLGSVCPHLVTDEHAHALGDLRVESLPADLVLHLPDFSKRQGYVRAVEATPFPTLASAARPSWGSAETLNNCLALQAGG